MKAPMLAPVLLLSLFLTLRDNVYSQIANGNFDLPGATAGSDCHAGTGWTTATGNMSSQYTNLLGPPTNFWIDITPCWSSGNGTYIEQEVPTVAGNCYYLKFDLGSYCQWDMSDAGVYITIDGNQLGQRVFNDSIDCNNQYKMNWATRKSQTFIATSATTTIRFTGEGRCTKYSLTSGYNCTPVGSVANPGVMGIDNIELVSAAASIVYASIDTGYYCGSGSGVPIKALGIPPSATVTWSVLNGTATIMGAGDSINVTAKESSQILLHITDADLCGQNSDTIIIIADTLKAEINIIDQRICAQDTILFNGSFSTNSSPAFIKTEWHFGDGFTSTNLNERHSYTQPGPHVVMLIVTDTGPCPGSDTAIKGIKDPMLQTPYVDLGPADTTVCSDVILPLPLGISARGTSYLWPDGSTTPRHYASRPGTYIVKLINDCGVGTDTITIQHKNCSIWFPDAFTPNGDGKNDIARLLGNIADISLYELHIFNRWGEEVFAGNDINVGWDGMYKGQPAVLDSYYYFIKFKYLGKDEIMKGNLILLR